MRTLEELKDRMSHELDELCLMDLLEINSEDLVERFSDKIEDRIETLIAFVFNEGDDLYLEDNDDS